jgi:hypothetical protein
MREMPGLIRAYNEATAGINLAALLASDFGRSDWPLTYRSRTLLFSPAARRAWVEPDLRPLPF